MLHGVRCPDLRQLVLVVCFLPLTSTNTLPALVVVTLTMSRKPILALNQYSISPEQPKPPV